MKQKLGFYLCFQTDLLCQCSLIKILILHRLQTCPVRRYFKTNLVVKQIELSERRLNFECLKRVNKINTVLGEVG